MQQISTVSTWQISSIYIIYYRRLCKIVKFNMKSSTYAKWQKCNAYCKLSSWIVFSCLLINIPKRQFEFQLTKLRLGHRELTSCVWSFESGLPEQLSVVVAPWGVTRDFSSFFLPSVSLGCSAVSVVSTTVALTPNIPWISTSTFTFTLELWPSCLGATLFTWNLPEIQIQVIS